MALCAGLREPSNARAAAIRRAREASSSSRSAGDPGTRSPYRSMNRSKSGCTSAPNWRRSTMRLSSASICRARSKHLRGRVGDGGLELGESVAGQFRPPAAHPVEQLPQAGHVPAGAVLKALLDQTAQRLVGVPVLEQVVHQAAQDVVAVQVAMLLAPVPAGVPGPGHSQPAGPVIAYPSSRTVLPGSGHRARWSAC